MCNANPFAYRISFRSSYIGRFITLVSKNNIKFDNFSITNRSNGFFRVVLYNCRLMYKYIFLGIITIDETVSTFYIEPFNGSGDFFGWKIIEIPSQFLNAMQ